MVVSTADMNASLALDMASYFFPTSRPFDRFEPAAQAAASDHRRLHHRHHHHHQQRQHQQETSPRPFDGGSLMAAACPLPGAKFVDLRSSLSIGPVAAAAAASAPAAASHDGQGFSSPSPSPSAAVATKNPWAALAHDLGRRAPISPRKGGGTDDDACVAAHHVIRGVTLGAGAASAGAGMGGGAARGEVGAGTGAAGIGGSPSFNARRRRPRGRRQVGINSLAAPAAAAAFGGEEAAQAGEALRRHHECPEWRTATDTSGGAPGMTLTLTASDTTAVVVKGRGHA